MGSFMQALRSFITGGFLSGYRTYILGFGVAFQALTSWAVLGELSLLELLEQLPEILGGAGLMTARAAIEKLLVEMRSLRQGLGQAEPPKAEAPAVSWSVPRGGLKPILLPLALALPFLALPGCAVFQAETPAQTVYALKSDYRAVLSAAVGYAELPPCPEVETPVCAEPDLVELIVRADARAEAALDGAEAVVRSPAASESAIALAIAAAEAAVSVVRQILTDEGVL
ncbi:MAG: hypothetical protein MJA83_08490 [Gammaproteobacteria bacterium]|nr:hypothetical protein [Gammaproteobacteria bacterium]